MKKQFLPFLLALALCLVFLTETAVAVERAYQGGKTTPEGFVVPRYVGADEVADAYGITFSPSVVDFGTVYVGEKAETRTVTITNNGPNTLDYGNYDGHYFQFEKGSPVWCQAVKQKIAPGESLEVKLGLDTDRTVSGTDWASADLLFNSHGVWGGTPGGGFAVGKDGQELTIENVVRVKYNIVSRDEAGFGYKLSETGPFSLGTLMTGGNSYNGTARYEKTITLTNTSDLPYRLNYTTEGTGRVSVDMLYDGAHLAVGDTVEIKISVELWDHLAGEDGETKVILTLSRNGGDLVEEIPLVFRYGLEKGSYSVAVGVNGQYGTALDDDGEPVIQDTAGDGLQVPNGGSFVMNLTPWNTTNGYVLYLARVRDPDDYMLEKAGPQDSDYVGSETRYALTGIKEDQRYMACFGEASVPPASWARDAVGRAEFLGLTRNGLNRERQASNSYECDYYYDLGEYTILDFSAPITRCEFCRLACNLYETVKGTKVEGYEGTMFSDISEFMDVPVRKMAYLGVITGAGDGTFNPMGELTREQAATILARLSKALGRELPAEAPSFTDSGAVASWATDAVGQMQASGIMGGVGNDLFAPQQTYSIEQSLVTLMRLYEMLK